MTLTSSDFAVFYRELYPDRDPFPWQQELVKKVLAHGWPEAIDIPTGLGKTSVLDIAVFCAAVDPASAPRRMFFVVDRRLIVDAAWRHAQHIAETLSVPSNKPVAQTVARALAQPGDNGPVLSVTRMRGGVTWDRTWLERPDRFAIVTGTVDQIGSRMLFRGYGVTPAARPIDAGLTGTDSLILIDEAHLSEPFRATLSAAADCETDPIKPVPRVVTMSATNRGSQKTVHRITDADRGDPEARRRLTAAKRIHLVDIAASKAKAAAAMTEAMADLAAQLSSPGSPVLVIANTVARARAIHSRLAKTIGDTVQVELLTGRSRAPDRELVTRRFLSLVDPDRDRHASQTTLILVATQTVEVGLDIDIDHIVSQSADLAALVQRLGRLNRRGELTVPVPRAIVVHDTTTGDKDPVYGSATQVTWEYLVEQAGEPVRYHRKLGLPDLGEGRDASPTALRMLADSAPIEAASETPYVPVLLPGIMDSWTRTAPTPVPDTPVDAFLHGVNDFQEPVTVVWRYGLDRLSVDEWAEVVAQLPPASGEGIDVPWRAMRTWLESQQDTANLSDIDTTNESDDEHETSTPTAPRILDDAGHCMVLRYDNDPQVVNHKRIRPGDTIVVPTVYGGCDIYGWHPVDATEVPDVADLAPRPNRTVLRIGDSLTHLAASPHTPNGAVKAINALVGSVRDDSDDQSGRQPIHQRITTSLEHLHHLLTGMAWADTPLGITISGLLTTHTRNAVTGFQPLLENLTEDTQLIHPWDVLVTNVHGGLLANDADTNSTSVSGRRISLRSHQKAVSKLAESYATNLGLSTELKEAVRLAALLHDEGKRDLRFQMMLAYQPDKPSLASEPLAKSGMDPADRAAFRRARQLSGYPSGARHEELSERIAAAHLADHPLRELICHLVASHHGHARPLMPPVPDPQRFDVTIDGLGRFANHEPVDIGHTDVFARLNRQYGRWGLALLETIVRLADQVASRDNQDPIPMTPTETADPEEAL